MHPTFRGLVETRARSVLDAAHAVTRVQHAGIKGQIREILVSNLFRPLLPADLGLGTGEIVSMDGVTSAQQDVVMFDRAILPPITFEREVGLYPIESVIYTVEVKSRLTRHELRSAHDAAEQLARMKYSAYRDNEFPSDLKPVSSIVFALSSDLATDLESELRRYDEIRDPYAAPPLRVICVPGRGCWRWDPTAERWTGNPGRGDQVDDVVSLIFLMMNTYKVITASRRLPFEPILGLYLAERYV